MSKWVPIVTVAALFGLTGLQDPIARDPFGAATIAVDNGQLASVLVNLHTSAGTGNGMGNIMTAFLNKTPLIITAGQQTREMILCDPMLTNRDETMLPRPYVKWAHQPTRAQDVPGAIMRAYALALQPPSGPVYVSIPLDDWDRPALGPAVVRTVSDRFAPDGDRLREFAKRISASKKLALVYGQEIERSGGWDAGVALAEKLKCACVPRPEHRTAVLS
jgi:benzoylformate decarboxylase